MVVGAAAIDNRAPAILLPAREAADPLLWQLGYVVGRAGVVVNSTVGRQKACRSAEVAAPAP